MTETELEIREYLTELSRRGVELWLEQGVLRYKCQRGSLQRSDLERLRNHKERIIESLSRTSQVERLRRSPRILPRLPSESVPLSGTQQGKWNLLERFKVRSKRSMVLSIRLTGPLSVELLRKSISCVVQRHEALRTRIVILDTTPFMEVHESHKVELPVADLTDIPADEVEHGARRAVDEFLDTPTSLANEDLFACRLYKLGMSDHVLVIALDHVIGDNISIGILQFELESIYTDLFRGRPISLAPVAIQFPDYAVWEKQQWTVARASFWEARIKSARRVRLPRGEPSPRSEKLQLAEIIPVQLGEPLSAALRQTSRQCGTTVVMAALSAYLAATLIWTGESIIISRFVSAGREIPGLDGTIGWLASELFLCVRLRPEDSFRNLLERVTREYYLALEYADRGRIGMERPCCLWNTSFNWRFSGDAVVPSGKTHLRPEQPASGVVATPFKFTPPTLDLNWSDDLDLFNSDPVMTLADSPSGIGGTFGYRPDLFSVDVLECFCDDFVRLTSALSRDPDCPVHAVSLLAHASRLTG